MTGPHWPSIIAVGIMNVLFVIILIGTKFWVVKRAMRSGMKETEDAIKTYLEEFWKKVTQQMQDSKVLLIAAEQHTKLLEDWEKHRMEEHERRDKEMEARYRQMIHDVLAQQLGMATKTVVNEVQANPEITAEKVVQKVERIGGMLQSGDSHHGLTPTPQLPPEDT